MELVVKVLEIGSTVIIGWSAGRIIGNPIGKWIADLLFNNK